MECKLEAVEVVEPVISVEFKFTRQKQKIFIHALLQCSKLDLEEIAGILNISVGLLMNVYNGKNYLNEEQAIQLSQLFLICFTD